MNYLLAILLLLCGCAGQTGGRKAEARSQTLEAGGQSVGLPAPAPVLVVNLAQPDDIAVIYPPELDATQYEWHADVSEDLQRWFSYYENEGTTLIYFPRGKTNTFVRLVGVPIQPQ